MNLEDLYRLMRNGHVRAQAVIDTIPKPLLVLDRDLCVDTIPLANCAAPMLVEAHCGEDLAFSARTRAPAASSTPRVGFARHHVLIASAIASALISGRGALYRFPAPDTNPSTQDIMALPTFLSLSSIWAVHHSQVCKPTPYVRTPLSSVA